MNELLGPLFQFKVKFAGLSFLAVAATFVVSVNLKAVSGPWDNPPPTPDSPGINGMSGTVVSVSTPAELKLACETIGSDTTILLQPGTYHLTTPAKLGAMGSHLSNVAIRGATGNRNDVILRGGSMSTNTAAHYGIQVFDAADVLIADLSVGDCWYHPIQLSGASGASNVHIYNCRVFEAGEQSIKSHASDNCVIEYCVIEYATTSRWYYAGGIDVHIGQYWTVRKNLFRNIRGPASDPNVDAAILFWNNSREPLIEQNTFINCRTGIQIGLTSSSYCIGGMVRNNFMFRQPGTVSNPNSGILVWWSPSVSVLHNTAILQQTGEAPIEFRDANALIIRNNLVDAAGNVNATPIWHRSGSFPASSGNVIDAQLDWFVNAAAGDLHLSLSASDACFDQVDRLADCLDDWDGDERPSGPGMTDVGADEYDSGYIPPDKPSNKKKKSGCAVGAEFVIDPVRLIVLWLAVIAYLTGPKKRTA